MELNECALTKVASMGGVDMQTAAKTVLYTVPAGKTFIPVFVVVREPTGTLAGGTSYGFGTGANADTHKQAVDLSGMTGYTYSRIVSMADADYIWCESGSEFGVKPTTGSTGAATATMDVFGYLY